MSISIKRLVDFLDNHAVEDWRQAHTFASVWVAGFWGAFGGLLSILPFFINMSNIWWLGPLLILMSITFAVARFTKQPGADI